MCKSTMLIDKLNTQIVKTVYGSVGIPLANPKINEESKVQWLWENVTITIIQCGPDGFLIVEANDFPEPILEITLTEVSYATMECEILRNVVNHFNDYNPII